MKKVDFDAYAGNYNELLRESTSFFTEDQSYFARYKVDVAASLLARAPSRILEFGCGIGRNIPFLRRAFPGAIVMGSDVSARSIDIAREENPDVTFWVDGKEPSDSSAFDLVFVAGVFHHIPPAERDAAAGRIERSLNPGGAAVVFEHNPYNPVTRRIVSQCPYDEGVRLLRPAELKRRLVDARLRVARIGYALFFPPKLKALAPLESALRWLPLGGQYWVLAVKGPEPILGPPARSASRNQS